MRTTKTKEHIISVFLRQLEQHSFCELSVTSITNEVGISRSVFYHYFTDIYDLLLYVTRDYYPRDYISDHGYHDFEAFFADLVSLWDSFRPQILHIVDSLPPEKLIMLYRDAPICHAPSLITRANLHLIQEGYPPLSPVQESLLLKTLFSLLNEFMLSYIYKPEDSGNIRGSFIPYASLVFQSTLHSSAIGIARFYPDKT